jgi:hypothetical protein
MRAVLCLFFCFSLAISEDFIVSYRQASAKGAILNQKLAIAKAMIAPPSSSKIKSGFAFAIDAKESDLGVYKLLNIYEDVLLENLLKNGVIMSDAAEVGRGGVDTKTVLTLKALRVRADVKGDIVTIAVYEDSDR